MTSTQRTFPEACRSSPEACSTPRAPAAIVAAPTARLTPPQQQSGDLAASWPAADRPPIDFVQYARDAFPRLSFHLRPGELVVDVGRYFARLFEDLASGPEGPCAESALRDCRALQALYGRKPVRRRETSLV